MVVDFGALPQQEVMTTSLSHPPQMKGYSAPHLPGMTMASFLPPWAAPPWPLLTFSPGVGAAFRWLGGSV